MSTDMKVAIAQDIIARLDSGQYIAGKDLYVWSPVLDGFHHEWDDDLQNHMEEFDEEPCQVCAIGAALISRARLFDSVNVQKVFKTSLFFYNDNQVVDANVSELRSNLDEIFGREQVALLEAAYELRRWYNDFDIDEQLVQDAISFGMRYDDRRERLRAVWQNVIDNDGIFTPSEVVANVQ